MGFLGICGGFFRGLRVGLCHFILCNVCDNICNSNTDNALSFCSFLIWFTLCNLSGMGFKGI